MTSNGSQSDLNFNRRISIVKKATQKLQQAKEPDEHRKFYSLISMASSTVGVEDQSTAKRLLNLIGSILG